MNQRSPASSTLLNSACAIMMLMGLGLACSTNLDPKPEVVQMCIDEIKNGNLSTGPRSRPEAAPEQEDCEDVLSYMHDGKNPIGNFEGRIRGQNAVEFAEKWLKDDQTNKENRKQ